jgi:5-methylcytosine-specific restriction endonuclease McrA
LVNKQRYDRERYLKKREDAIARARAWALANPERRREIVRKNNVKRKHEKAEWHQLKTFGTVIKKEVCARCGTTDGGPKGLVVHHRDGCNGNGEQPLNNDPENLIVLCRACHVRVHSVWGLKEVVPQ